MGLDGENEEENAIIKKKQLCMKHHQFVQLYSVVTYGVFECTVGDTANVGTRRWKGYPGPVFG